MPGPTYPEVTAFHSHFVCFRLPAAHLHSLLPLYFTMAFNLLFLRAKDSVSFPVLLWNYHDILKVQ